MKKLLALVLALVMTLGLATVGTSAAYSDFTDTADVSFEEAMKVMNAVGVFVGDNGKLDPKGNLTRAQAAKLVAYLALGEDIAEALPKTGSKFADVKDGAWYTGYVNYMVNEGYTTGTSETTFSPDGQLNGYQFGAFLLAVLGYDRNLEGMVGNGWETKVAVKLEECGITDGVDKLGSAALTREEAAQFCLNALKADTVKYSDKGTSIDLNGAKITTGAKSAEVVTVTADSKYTAIDGTKDGTKDIVQLGEKLYKGDLKVQSVNDKAGRTARKWTYPTTATSIGTFDANKASSKFAVSSTSGTLLATLYGQLKDKNNDYRTGTAADTAAALTADATNFGATASGTVAQLFVNGTAAPAGYAPKVGDQVEVYTLSGNANTITKVVVLQYKLAKISKVDNNVSTTDKNNDVTAYVTLKDAQGNQIGAVLKDTQIAGFDAASYVKDAYIAAAFKADGSIVDSFVVTPAAEGSVTAYKTDTSYTIGGTTYKIVKSGSFVEDYVEDDFTGTYAIYTDANGYAIGLVKVEAGKVSSDAVWVNYLWTTTDNNTYKEKVETSYAQIVDMTGAVKTVTIGKTDRSGNIYGAVLTDLDHDGSMDNGGDKYLTFKKVSAPAISAGSIPANYYCVTNLGTVTKADTTWTNNATYVMGYAAGTTANVKWYQIDTQYGKFASPDTDAEVVADRLYTTTEDSTNGVTKLTEYVTGNGYYVAVNGANSDYSATDKAITSSATRLGSTTYYVNADTKYVFVEGTGSAAKVTTATGSNVSYKSDATGYVSAVVSTKSGTAYIADYVVIRGAITAATAKDVVYVGSASTAGTDATGTLYNIYEKDGNKKAVPMASAPTAYSYWAYSVNSKGEYDLSAPTNGNEALNAVWSKTGTGHLGEFNDMYFQSVYGDKITVDDAAAGGSSLADIPAANAVVVDLHDTDQNVYVSTGHLGNGQTKTTYTGTISDVASIASAKDSGYTVQIDLYVTEDGVQTIFVLDVYKDNNNVVTATVTEGVAGSNPSVTVAVDNSANTIVVTVPVATGALAASDYVEVTVTRSASATAAVTSGLTSFNATASATTSTFRLVYATATGWASGNLTITAEDGTSRVYAVSVVTTVALTGTLNANYVAFYADSTCSTPLSSPATSGTTAYVKVVSNTNSTGSTIADLISSGLTYDKLTKVSGTDLTAGTTKPADNSVYSFTVPYSVIAYQSET